MKIWACLPHSFKILLRSIYCYIMYIGVLLYVCKPHSANRDHRRALLMPPSYCLLKSTFPRCWWLMSSDSVATKVCRPALLSFGFFMLTCSEVNWNSSSHTSQCTSLPPITLPLGGTSRPPSFSRQSQPEVLAPSLAPCTMGVAHSQICPPDKLQMIFMGISVWDTVVAGFNCQLDNLESPRSAVSMRNCLVWPVSISVGDYLDYFEVGRVAYCGWHYSLGRGSQNI